MAQQDNKHHVMSCKINEQTWNIYLASPKYVLNAANKDRNDDEKLSYTFGLCTYIDHSIYISNELCMEELRPTILHELMHAYIWSIGGKDFTSFDEEDVCNLFGAAFDVLGPILDNVIEYFKLEAV